LDTADTCSVNDCESDVAGFSPLGSPGVLYDPVFLLCKGIKSPSNSEDGVIEFSTTRFIIDDTGLVLMENWLVGFNSNRDWAVNKSSLEIVWVSDSYLAP